MSGAKLTGPEKAALFLLSLGEEFASEIFKRLNEEEMQRLAETMARKPLTPEVETVDLLYREFSDIFEGKSSGSLSGDLFLRRTLSKALDGERAASFMNNVREKKASRPFERLRQLDPSTLFNFIRDEHPQTVALVLAHLPHQTAARLLKLFPEEVRADVIMRLARLENVPSEILSDIEEVLEHEITSTGEGDQYELGGIEVTAEIMNQLDQETESQIMTRIEEEYQGLAEDIRRRMFIFEDLGLIDDRGIRTLLKEVSNDDLILALKTASDGLREKIFANLSERAAQMLREDIELMGPARLSEVEQAQQMIIVVARRLEEEGKIVIAGKGGEDVLV